MVNHDFRRPLDGPEQDGGPGGRGGNYSHGQAQDDLLQFRHDSSNFGLRLVQKRGQAMQAAADATPSAMVSVLGLEPAKVAEYRGGRDKLYGFFVGQVMKAMGGKANPKVINDILKKKLGL